MDWSVNLICILQCDPANFFYPWIGGCTCNTSVLAPLGRMRMTWWGPTTLLLLQCMRRMSLCLFSCGVNTMILPGEENHCLMMEKTMGPVHERNTYILVVRWNRDVGAILCWRQNWDVLRVVWFGVALLFWWLKWYLCLSDVNRNW